jgi:hypothetical protein
MVPMIDMAIMGYQVQAWIRTPDKDGFKLG